MEIRSTRSFNVIPATIIRGVLTSIYQICYLKFTVNNLLIFSFIFTFFFNHCKLFF